jgi:phage-related protein
MAVGGSRTLKLSILGDVDQLKKSLQTANADVEKSSSTISDFGKKAGLAFAAVGVAAGAFAVKFGVDAIKAASDLNETISKTSVLFGSAAGEVEKFAATAAGKLGQSKQQALDAAATFATFGKAAGLAGNDLVKFSTDFVGLASDLASFNNTSPEQAINAIGSALRGEAEPLRAYGVLLDDASLRQAALELGIVSTTKNALTPQQKVLAAQELIYKQTGAAQGDFGRTSDGLANSQRILSAQLENVKTTIGTALLPAATALFGFIGTNLIPLIQNWSESFSTSLKPAIEDISTFFQNDLLPIFQTWWELLSTIIIPGIVATVTPIIKGLFSAFSSIAKAIKDNEENLKPLFDLFVDVAKFVYTNLAPAIGTVLGGAFKLLGDIIGGVIGLIGKVVSSITNAIDLVSSLASKIANLPVIGGIFGGASLSSPSMSSSSQSSQTVINLNVSGALDSEGTARTVINTLNDSFYRGTLGAGGLVSA